MKKPFVIIIGAGPAGLTAALEILRDGRFTPLLLEASDTVGGISRTVNYKGNRMDIGGHRFFSKSDWVMDTWRDLLPLVSTESVDIHYHGQQKKVGPSDTAKPAMTPKSGSFMLVRNRLSRIYFLRKYFDYPIKLNGNTIRNLGLRSLLRIGFSYSWAMLFPRRPERSLEDFLVNRFGGELYRTFFRDYTEKVWGVPCEHISAEWGAQRIKGLSVIEAIKHALRRDRNGQATKTSLIEHFLYPRLGPGQLWEEAARRVHVGGGEIRFGAHVTGLRHEGGRVLAVRVETATGAEEIEGVHFISTMPVKDLVAGMNPPPPVAVAEVAAALPYRDFITVGLLVSRMRANAQAGGNRTNHMPPDNWIYIQESDVRIGRLQIFNNWSPDLVATPDAVWLGLEYFCQEGDGLWSLSDKALRDLAISELEKIGMIDGADVLDATVIRVPKTYPAYFGAYERFSVVREWLDGFANLWLVGRNGMHRYNNQDHSMLTAKIAVETILSGTVDKTAIWAVNIDDDYHEEVEVTT